MTVTADPAPKKERRPRRTYTATEVAEAVRAAKGMISVAARSLGCDPDTIRHQAKRHPIVAQAITEARALTTDIAELALFKAIQSGEAWAVCFYLKTQGKDRGYIEQVNHRHGGDADNPVKVDHTHKVDADALQAAERTYLSAISAARR